MWEGEWVFYQMKEEDLLTEFSCKHGVRQVSSSLAKLSNQLGGLPSNTFFLFLENFLSPSSPSLLFFILIYNLTETDDSHSVSAQRLKREHVGAATGQKNFQGGAACTRPIDVTYSVVRVLARGRV